MSDLPPKSSEDGIVLTHGAGSKEIENKAYLFV